MESTGSSNAVWPFLDSSILPADVCTESNEGHFDRSPVSWLALACFGWIGFLGISHLSSLLIRWDPIFDCHGPTKSGKKRIRLAERDFDAGVLRVQSTLLLYCRG